MPLAPRSLSDCSHLVSTCSGRSTRSTVHGGPCATQSSGGAVVRIPLGSPRRVSKEHFAFALQSQVLTAAKPFCKC